MKNYLNKNWKSLEKKIGFKYIRQLNGGFKTDFDYPNTG